jgi:hypothetical protein
MGMRYAAWILGLSLKKKGLVSRHDNQSQKFIALFERVKQRHGCISIQFEY